MQHPKRPAHTPLGQAWETFERAKEVFDLAYWGASIEVFERAKELFQQQLEDQGVAMCHAAIAAALNNNGKPRKAIEHGLEALSFYERIDSKPQLAEQSQNLALMYSALAQNEKAEEFHVKAAENYRAFDQPELAAQNLLTAANLLARRRQPDSARPLFTEAISLFAEVQDPTADHARATALMQLAYLEKLENNSDAARLLYLEALEIFEQLNAHWEIGTCLEGLAAVEFDAHEPAHASEHAKEALRVFRAHGYDEDARRAAANYQATLIAASFTRRGKGYKTRKEDGEES